jgi:hypothetical protein
MKKHKISRSNANIKIEWIKCVRRAYAHWMLATVLGKGMIRELEAHLQVMALDRRKPYSRPLSKTPNQNFVHKEREREREREREKGSEEEWE